MDTSDVIQGDGGEELFSQLLAHGQTLLVILQRLRVVALLRENVANIIGRPDNAGFVLKFLAQPQALLVESQRLRVIALSEVDVSDTAQRAGNPELVANLSS